MQQIDIVTLINTIIWCVIPFFEKLLLLKMYKLFVLKDFVSHTLGNFSLRGFSL